MKLRAKRKKSSYKNDNTWLRAVYRNNKTEIDEKLKFIGEKNKFKIFKQLVEDEKKIKGLSTYQAVNRLSRTEVFKTKSERFNENAWKGLRGNKEAFKQFRQSIGWKNKIDESKLVYNYNEKAYIYDNKVKIMFQQSPPKIEIYK